MLKYYFAPEENKEIEKAICFLVENMTRTGHNEKPVIQHSLQVGFVLQELGYEKNVVIAGILHDLLEDSDVKIEQICEEFGEEVSGIVSAVSFDKSILDPREQYMEMYDRVVKQGLKAVVVKAVDIACNSQYICLVKNNKKQEFLREKAQYFLTITKDFQNESAWKLLDKKISRQEYH